ncbi:MAG: hypothetical protein MZV64_64885 [Ignavibacteriales bacterium]|nr:hypothetical protein [Ignavibacteriales bacterium]
MKLKEKNRKTLWKKFLPMRILSLWNQNIWQQVEKEFEDETNLVAKFASSLIIEAIEKTQAIFILNQE